MPPTQCPLASGIEPGPIAAGARLTGRCRWRPWALACLLLIGPALPALAGAAPAAAPAARRAGNTQEVTLNLKDTDIQALIATVAEVTGKNFVVDPRVRGKVTVISSRPVNQDELYQVFLSILQVHGFAAVPAGNVIKIVPDVTAKQDALPLATRKNPGAGDEMVTRVVHVNNVSAAQLVPILRPLIPQQGHLAAYPSSNMLVISDRADNVDRMVKIIRRIDSTSSSGVDIVHLRHASAADVVHILTSLQSRPQGGAAAGQAPVVVADERTNSVLIGGDRSARLRLQGLIAHLDTATQSTGNTEVVYLHYADAKKLVPVLKSVVKGQTGAKAKGTPSQPQEVEITADESTNALVITAPPDLQRSLVGVIHRLDIRRAEVLVEAVIAEVSANRAAQLGVQFNAAQGFDNKGGVGGTNFSTGGTPLTTVAQNPLTVGDGLSLGFIRGTGTLFGNQVLNIATLIQALSSDTSTNILSTPTLLTLDNQEAEIVVGQNVPFVTGQFTNTGAGSTGTVTPFQTIERHDVGLTLKVKPQINKGNTVKLKIQQEVSSLTNSTQAADVITNKRLIKTTVLVNSGRIIVLGGLIDQTHTEGVEKVPVLGDLPVIGALFRSHQSKLDKTNLMVFLRPVILRGSGLARAYTDEKYGYIRSRQEALQRKGVFLMPHEKAPMLPPLSSRVKLPPPFDAQPQDPARQSAPASH